MDDLERLGVDEVIFIVGHLRAEFEAWVAAEYPDLRCHHVLQEVQDGTAGAIRLAEPWVDEEVLIIFADAVLEVDYGLIREIGADYDAIIWAKEVEDYQRFGVIVTNDDGTMQRIVEKPSEPVSKLANIGLYYVRDHRLLFEGIHDTITRGAGPSGEYFLTDAFQYMVDHGSRIATAPVRGLVGRRQARDADRDEWASGRDEPRRHRPVGDRRRLRDRRARPTGGGRRRPRRHRRSERHPRGRNGRRGVLDP